MGDVHAEQRWERWRQDLAQVCGRFTTDPGHDLGRFRGNINLRRSLGLDYAEVMTNARRVARGAEDVRQDGGRYCFLIYQLSGRAVMGQEGRAAVLGAGDMVLIDSSRPCEFRYGRAAHQLSFHLPGETVRRICGGMPSTAVRLAADEAMAGLVQSLVTRAHSHAESAGEATGQAFIDALAARLAPLAGSDRPRGAPDVRLTAAMICHFVDANLDRSTLSPSSIARALGCSTRHVHRCFVGEGVTVGEYIALRRLDCCAADLADPAFADETVTGIAFRWGFTDAGNFSRSFRRRFGCAPRDWRAARLGA